MSEKEYRDIVEQRRSDWASDPVLGEAVVLRVDRFSCNICPNRRGVIGAMAKITPFEAFFCFYGRSSRLQRDLWGANARIPSEATVSMTLAF